MKKFSQEEFLQSRREPLLIYKVYEYNFEEMIEGFGIVRDTLAMPVDDEPTASLYEMLTPLEQRAWDSMTFLVNCYSGGHEISEIREFFPVLVEYWGSYARDWQVFQKSGQSSTGTAATIPLLDIDFVYANQLICFAILLNHSSLLRQIAEIVDFNNPRMDGMLERLLGPYLSDRDSPPDACTRHLPYFKTLKIFSAPVERRPELMAEYLKDWYAASRRERYYDSHKRGNSFKGYWSWEAAAITYLLDIDDRSYRNAEFYPSDLVEYARSIHALRSASAPSALEELRVKSGQACLKSGPWETLDIPVQRREFRAGEIMQTEDASYGITVWRYVGI